MSLIGTLAKKFGSSLAKKTSRGEAKEALKAKFKKDGLSDTEATNKANLEIRKAEGKETALRKTETKQDRDTGRFKGAGEKGGTKTLSLEATDTKSGQRVSMKRPTDKASTVRATAERQKLRSAGEKLYEAGLKDAAKTRAKKAGAVAGAAGAASAAMRSGGNEESKTTKAAPTKSTATAGSKDQRVNPKDFPTYRKSTDSAKAFRDAFKKAKDDDKKTFSFEGRTYKVEDGPSQKMMKGGYAMKGKK
jgi:hypothetical protein